MQRGPRISVDNSSTEESNGRSSGCNNDSSEAETQQLLERRLNGAYNLLALPPHNKHPVSCRNSHPLSNRRRRNAQLRKRNILQIFLNAVYLILILPVCLVKKACNFSSRESWSQRIVSCTILFLLIFGAGYLGLFDGSTLQIFGDGWKDFSICDCIEGERKDLRSLIKAHHILQRRALVLTALKEETAKLQSQLHFLSSNMDHIVREAVREVLANYTSKGITTWTVQKMLTEMMDKLDEHEVQMPDYALASAGASIVHCRTTRSYRHEGGNYYWMSFPILPFVRPPEVMLQPNRSPGMCWSFPTNRGEAVIKLVRRIFPTMVTLEHISKKVSPTGKTDSAPKDFVIYGLKEENEEDGLFLGDFVYNAEGDVVQTFKLQGNTSD
ncbi:SUN domain-containing protein 3 [Sphaerodactylus townsendi]|uniref:SUN domain-containing protein 3 n=1 Tax=Sphaerodactylus townsendi TaxID=933632 RepID=UPI0020269243|nr:SUN domain-containing protein 3 [Sphaerodactylus townsendi]